MYFGTRFESGQARSNTHTKPGNPLWIFPGFYSLFWAQLRMENLSYENTTLNVMFLL